MGKHMSVAEFAKVKKGCLGECHGDGPPDLSFLNGKKIIGAGMVDTEEGLKLCIDYRDGKNTKRVCFGHNELGFWIEWCGLKGVLNEVEALRERLREKLEAIRDRKDFPPTIKDDAFRRGYAFVGENDEELLFLSCYDVKRMGTLVSDKFRKVKKNFDKIWGEMEYWAKSE